MRRPTLFIAALSLLLAPLAIAASPRASTDTAVSRSVLHAQRFPGGLSNGVRAMLYAQSLHLGASGVRSVTVGGSGNLQMNGDCPTPVPQDETAVALDDDEPLEAVAGANDYCLGGDMLMHTQDGGQTWTSQAKRPFIADKDKGCFGGDPSIAYSLRDDAFYATSLCFAGIGGFSAVHLWKSTDGETWTPSRLASVAVSNRTGSVTDGSLFYDKETMTIDNHPSSPFFGRIYISFTKFHILADGSSDYCPVQVAYTDNVPTPDPSQAVWSHTAVVPDNPGGGGLGESANQNSQPRIESDGTLDVAYQIEDCNTGHDLGLRLQKSSDGGASFLASPVTVDKPGQFKDNSSPGDLLPPTAFRAPLSMSFAVNKATGTLLIAYQNNVNRPISKADISYQTSTNGGFTWSDAKFLSVDANGDPAPNDQFFPAVDSDEAGGWHVIWFDRRLDPLNIKIDTWQADSTDDAASWTSSRISTYSWNPNKGFFDCGCFVGDYNGIAASTEAIYPVWTDGRYSAIDQTGIGETDIFTNVELSSTRPG
jgi:hypothetical protein